ncbi:hypothetical protein DSO57_1032618 [Entomophthora muscae]|uniref:Uncharacterized protein n=1 Tax=Entomophthora muscae TaxID=34485 RepID=A0ACC2TN16_9FUNG|nr:hypothetical protein DSO57_1032618 [Entomophthora muscae]
MKLLTATIISLVAGQNLFINDFVSKAKNARFFSVLPFTGDGSVTDVNSEFAVKSCVGFDCFLSDIEAGKYVFIELRFDTDLNGIYSAHADLEHYTGAYPDSKTVQLYQGVHLINTSTKGYSTLISQIDGFKETDYSKSRITLPYVDDEDFKKCVKRA